MDREALVIGGSRILAGEGLEEVSGDILIEDGRIRSIGQVGRHANAQEVDAAGMYVVPGLIDAHVHFGLAGAAKAYEFWRASPLLRSLAQYRNGLIALANGVTSVRDLGAADHSVIDYAREVDAGRLLGPSVTACGHFIVMTGGHGWEWGRQADGADEVRRAVREQIRAGAA